MQFGQSVDSVLILVSVFALSSAALTVAKSYRDPWRMLLLSMPLLIVLTPGVGNAPAVRVEEVFLFLLAPFIILRKPTYKLAKVELFFLLYGIAVVISIFVGYLLDGTLFFRDLFELVRLAKYWLMVRLAVSVTWSEENAFDAVKVILWTGLLGACIAFAQSRNSFAINSVYTPFFIEDFRLASIQYQVAGTIQNYNLFGTFLAMVASVALGVLLFAKLSFKQNMVTCGILLALVIALARTTSKGAVVALLASMLLLWSLRLALDRTRRATYLLALIATLTLGIILARATLGTPHALADGNPMRSLVGRFQVEGLERSLELRVADWELALDLASQSLVFGSGPSKDEGVRAFHSEYLTHLRRYGLFGLTIYILFLAASAQAVLRLLRSRETAAEGKARALLAGTLGMICVFAITSVVYQVFQQLQLAAIFWWFVGIAFAYGSSVRTRKLHLVASTDPARAALCAK